MRRRSHRRLIEPLYGAGMNRNRKLIALAAVVLAAAAGGVAYASGVGDDDATDTPITGAALAKAKAAALAHTGGGEVTETEVGDEESLYEVEVTLPNGDQVDVQLDEDFEVVGSEGDDDSQED
jgi:uncharacterized membrane protein YkoI